METVGSPQLQQTKNNSSTPMTGTTSVTSLDQFRERLRREHSVRLINRDEDGNSFHWLPAGVYGFTYAPATETPLFGARSYHSFEVHKLADGSGILLGCCSKADAEKIAAARAGSTQPFEVMFYPDPFGEAAEPAAVPFPWILNELYKLERRDGNGVKLRLAGE